MSTFTPGPWHDDGYRIYAPVHKDGTPLAPDEDKRNGRVIVEYKHVDDFNDADGPLIALAPEMYALLRRCLPYMKTVSRSDNYRYEENDGMLYEEMKAVVGDESASDV